MQFNELDSPKTQDFLDNYTLPILKIFNLNAHKNPIWQRKSNVFSTFRVFRMACREGVLRSRRTLRWVLGKEGSLMYSRNGNWLRVAKQTWCSEGWMQNCAGEISRGQWWMSLINPAEEFDSISKNTWESSGFGIKHNWAPTSAPWVPPRSLESAQWSALRCSFLRYSEELRVPGKV